ncbi:MAG: hypothetical protein R3263_00100 [Myxococcota bacterium]|nr:hypothetical protein [Myxococcota bacterium]
MLPPADLALGATGHEIRALRVVAGGTCRRCAEGTRRRPRRVAPGPPPLGHASPRSLRLLVGYALLEDPGALERAGLLPPGGSRPACLALFRAVGAVLDHDEARRALDDVLRRQLADAARRFDRLCVAALADRLAGHAETSRPALHALLWSVARRPGVPFRRLEPRVADRIEAHRAEEEACPRRPES